MKFKVITLCGSTKFKNEFIKMQKILTLQGNIVISLGCFSHSECETLDEYIKQMLVEMHKQKIIMSDEIFIINKDGYIGDQTKSEIAYAKLHGKKIRYMEEVISNE